MLDKFLTFRDLQNLSDAEEQGLATGILKFTTNDAVTSVSSFSSLT